MDFLTGGSRDPDKIFSYDTRQVVKIRDRSLGITLYFLYFIMCNVILFGVFLFGEGYVSYDYAMGGVATFVKGDTVAKSASGTRGFRYYSAEDITYPGLENGNVFVATRETITKQKRGSCDDKSMPCETDADCHTKLGGKCGKQGLCNEPGWCPVDVEEEPDKYDIDSMNIQVWAQSFVHFSLLDKAAKKDPLLKTIPGSMGGNLEGKMRSPFVYSMRNQNITTPQRGVNLFSVGELLRRCKPVPVRYEEVAELGAAIEVVFSWSCYMSNPECKPDIWARRLDVLFDAENIGFSLQRADYDVENERTLHELRGIRLFFKSVGRGSILDSNATLLKFATTTSLLCLAPLVADLLMLKCFKERKRYQARKYQQSPVFDDQDYLNKVQEREGRIAKVGHIGADAELQRREQAFNKRILEEEDDE